MMENKMKYEQQYLQPVHTHPIAFLIQTLQLIVRYVPESGAHADRSQGRWRGQYI
jgi:hypothetical protein